MIRQASSVLPVPLWFLYYKRLAAYLRAGWMLHLFCISTFALFMVCLLPLFDAEGWELLTYTLLSAFFFSVTVTTQLDAYSRYQNYKFIKDLFHEYGFRELLLRPFSRSKCQRDAVLEASTEPGFRADVNRYFYGKGYRWYHIVPSLLIENPLLLLTRGYWLTTFFVPRYDRKYFYW
jgi:hypothetical protein